MRSLILALVCAFVGGCNLLLDRGNDELICTAEARSAITVRLQVGPDVEVTDSTFVLHALDGAYRDSALFFVLPDEIITGVAHERPGVYTAQVRQDGTVVWEKRGITVTQGPCHVNTVMFDVEL